ncbi:MAG: hypothetical protein JWQ35_2252 [Bacteriovoracaceae bacterium]|nr:hypothetical protein [Bacteriovoracaceae bacterium]
MLNAMIAEAKHNLGPAKDLEVYVSGAGELTSERLATIKEFLRAGFSMKRIHIRWIKYVGSMDFDSASGTEYLDAFGLPNFYGGTPIVKGPNSFRYCYEKSLLKSSLPPFGLKINFIWNSQGTLVDDLNYSRKRPVTSALIFQNYFSYDIATALKYGPVHADAQDNVNDLSKCIWTQLTRLKGPKTNFDEEVEATIVFLPASVVDQNK